MKITKSQLKQIILEEIQGTLDLGPPGIEEGAQVMIKLDPDDSMIMDENGKIDNNKLEWVRNIYDGKWGYSGVNTLRLFRAYRDERFYGEMVEPRTGRHIGEVVKREGIMAQVGFRNDDGKPFAIIKLNINLLEPAESAQ